MQPAPGLTVLCFALALTGCHRGLPVPQAAVTHDLAGTRWALTHLHGVPVDVGRLQREPFIVLNDHDHRVTGHASCNRAMGSYRLDGEQLAFERLSLTRSACPDMKLESMFWKALRTTARWKIDAAHLQLFDANGTTLARFEARNL